MSFWLGICVVAVAIFVVFGAVTRIVNYDVDRMEAAVQTTPERPTEMNELEYQTFYDTNEMPERFWMEEFTRLREEYTVGKITQQELEDAHDDMMGITRLEYARTGVWPRGVYKT